MTKNDKIILQKRLKPKEYNGDTISRTHDLIAPVSP